MVGNPCCPLPAGRRNEQGGQVDYAADLAVARDAVHFLVIGFGGVQHVMSRDHAVPIAVRLKVADVGVRDGMRLDKLAEVGNERPGTRIAVHPVDPVGHLCICM